MSGQHLLDALKRQKTDIYRHPVFLASPSKRSTDKMEGA